MRKPLEPGHKAFQHHPGLVGKPWRGMSREGNRLLPDDNQFHLLQNMRLIGGQWQNRGGQEKANAAAMSGTAVTGIYTPDKDLNASGSGGSSARVLYQREPTLPTFSNYMGKTFDTDGSGKFRGFTSSAITELNSGDLRPLGIADHGGGDKIYYTDGQNLYESEQLPEGFTLPTPIATVETTNSYDGAGFHGNALEHGGDVLFFFNAKRTSDNARGIIYAWDGATLTEEADTTTYITTGGSNSLASLFADCFFILGTDAYLCSYTEVDDGEGGTIYTTKFFKRASGGGSWSTALTIDGAAFDTLGGAGSTDDYLSGGAVISSKSYHSREGGTDYEWYSFDGTTAVLEHTVTGWTSGSAPHAAPVVFNGYMYYNHQDDPFTTFKLGRFDGTTWDDTYDPGPQGLLTSGVVIDSVLYLAVDDSQGSGGLYKSDGTDTTTWSLIGTSSEDFKSKLVTFP